jgi:hypothetical protein
MRLVRFVLGCLASIAAVALVLQALAINAVGTLFPKGWSWTRDARTMWILLAALTIIILALARLQSLARSRARVLEDLANLSIKNEMGLQSVLYIYKPPSVRIRWTLTYAINYSGNHVLEIYDLAPEFPERIANGVLRFQLAIKERSERFVLFPSFADLTRVDGIRPEFDQSNAEFELSHDWPLLLKPGDKVHLRRSLEYVLLVDGKPVTISSDQVLMDLLGPYLGMEEDEDGTRRITSLWLPTIVATPAGQFRREIAYLVSPAGGTYLMTTNWDELSREEPL